MSSLNITATLSLFRLITKPSLCLPQATVPTFNELPIPLNKAFEQKYKGVDIRAVVLDKDNCFAWPKENVVAKGYEVSHELYISREDSCYYWYDMENHLEIPSLETSLA
jgi:hypothetical protein